MIRFCCEHCGRKISVPDEYVGKRGKCPECDAAFVVPARPDTIELQCENCGHEIGVPRTCAGKTVKCPACNFIVAIPAQKIEPAGIPGVVQFSCSMCHRRIVEPESSRGKLIPCPHCDSYVAVPMPESPTQDTEIPIQPIQEIDESAERFEQLQIGSIKEFKQEVNVVTERKLPWILDIFLYPMSMSGMAVLAIVVLTRFFFRVTVIYLGEASQQFLPCLAFFGLTWGLGMIVRAVLYMYLCWYLCECVRSSAAGGVRATETKGHTPGLGDMFGGTIKTGVCVLILLGPAIFYFLETGETDVVFWCLVVCGLFLFPMSFLAIVIFESWQGLNPFLLIGSIFGTFLPYTAMVLTFITTVFVIIKKAPNPWTSHPAVFFVTWLLGVYLVMVAAHLLGWFYHRYEEELNWDV